jgi:hypothetical protein
VPLDGQRDVDTDLSALLSHFTRLFGAKRSQR